MKISLITVCYNSEKTVEDTLKSVLQQNYENYEYIVIDGKSKDHTIDIVKKYEQKFAGRLKFISEPDKGIYDAMNKGIKLAKGDIIGILNSDDVLTNSSVFDKIVTAFKNNDVDGVYSNLVFLDETLQMPVRNFIAHKQSKVLGWHPPHPNLYLKTEVYESVGYFDLNYKIAADYDFMLRMLKNNFKLYYIDDYLVKMRSGGVSTNGLKGYFRNLKEADSVLRKNHISFPVISNITRIIKTIFQGFSAKINAKKILKKL